MPSAPASLHSAALDASWPGLVMEWVDRIDSTNSELMRRAHAGQTPPVLLAARRQSAGRGRLGRSWLSEAREPDPSAAPPEPHGGAPRPAPALTFSLGLPLTPLQWSGLSLTVGLAVAQALDADGQAGLQIKWPNDLWRHGCKLAGILIETAPLPRADGPLARYAVIGIGLNIAPLPAHDLRTPPAWLQQWQPEATAERALAAIAPVLLAHIRRFVQQGFAPLQPHYAARDALRGCDVQLSDQRTGLCEGVGPLGELLVRSAEGVLLTIHSAEVSVRPRSVP